MKISVLFNPFLGLALLLAMTQIVVSPQSRRSNPPLVPSVDKNSNEDEQNSSMADEMRVKREIMYAEKEHRQKLDRAKEAEELAKQLADSVKGKNTLSKDELKKLDKIEKLAKWLRSEAGGSDTEVTIEKRPTNLGEAICSIAEASTSLSNDVKETPRQVVSAAIIDKANVLLELIGIARSFSLKVSN